MFFYDGKINAIYYTNKAYTDKGGQAKTFEAYNIEIFNEHFSGVFDRYITLTMSPKAAIACGVDKSDFANNIKNKECRITLDIVQYKGQTRVIPNKVSVIK